MTMTSIVFLPGFMCDWRLFAPQIRSLSASGVDCRIGDLSSAATIERMASMVLDCAPEKFALAGLSMGGIVAMEIMRQAPERISHLALLNTTARADAAADTRKSQMKRILNGELSMILRDELKPRYLAECNRTPEILSSLERMGEALGEEVFVKQSMALMVRKAAVDVLPSITCPTLILAGEDDRVSPVDRHEEIAAGIPGAKLTVLENCGHISTLERPNSVTRCLRSLLKLPNAAVAASSPPRLRLVERHD